MGWMFNTLNLVYNYLDQRYDVFRSNSGDGCDDLNDEDEYGSPYGYDLCE
jgi:hypothetical protein